MKTLCPWVLAGLLVGLTVLPCTAAPVTLNAIDRGWYTEDGRHNPANDNYLTGNIADFDHRSFFVFDLSSIVGTIQSATLRLFNPKLNQSFGGYFSPDPTETLSIYDVTTPAASVIAGTASVAGFADFGSGAFYGSTIVSPADNGRLVQIVLNGTALADLNAATGLFVLGGALSSLNTENEWVFGYTSSDFGDRPRQLALEVLDAPAVPEPSTFALLAIGAGLIVAARRRQRR